MTSVKELKKTKRKLKTAITKSLTDLAGRLSESQPDRTGIRAVLEGIEERKQEVLSVMEELESALEKEEQTDEAEKIGDEADSLIDKIDQETSQARSFLASIGISSKAIPATSVDTQECNPHVANSEPHKQLERIRIPMFTGKNWSFNNGLRPFLPVSTPHRWRLNSRCLDWKVVFVARRDHQRPRIFRVRVQRCRESA